MKRHTFIAATAGVLGFITAASAPASAALVADGITYDLEAAAPVGLTRTFALKITGENTASDTEKGRTGINGFAFNETSNGATATGHVIATSGFSPATFAFVLGGLNSGGCAANVNTNFYCFDNTAIPPTPTTALSGPLIIVFDVTLKAGGSWANYAPDFKIDWVGTRNNYDLVSKQITPDSTCPDCGITPVIIDAPEPATLAVLGMGLIGLGAVRRRRV